MVRPCLAHPYKEKPFDRTPDLACLNAHYLKLYIGSAIKLSNSRVKNSKYHDPENRMSLSFLLLESIKEKCKKLALHNRSSF